MKTNIIDIVEHKVNRSDFIPSESSQTT